MPADQKAEGKRKERGLTCQKKNPHQNTYTLSSCRLKRAVTTWTKELGTYWGGSLFRGCFLTGIREEGERRGCVVSSSCATHLRAKHPKMERGGNSSLPTRFSGQRLALPPGRKPHGSGPRRIKLPRDFSAGPTEKRKACELGKMLNKSAEA